MAFVATVMILHGLASFVESDNRVSFSNDCGETVWIGSVTAANSAGQLPSNAQEFKLTTNQVVEAIVPSQGWNGLWYAKTGCNGSGRNCQTGEPTGLQANTLFEFNFAPPLHTTWYDISLVNGYNVGGTIEVTTAENGHDHCVMASCPVTMDMCPQNNTVYNGGRAVHCASECTHCVGVQRKAVDSNSCILSCCPHPVSVGDCQAGPVSSSSYCQLVHSTCDRTYCYAYDDVFGLLACPIAANYHITICGGAGNVVNPGPPNPVPGRGCTSEDDDPWKTGSYIECCAGTTSTLANWQGDRNYYFLCKDEEIQIERIEDPQ